MGSGYFDPVRRLLITESTKTRLSPLESEVLFFLLMSADRTSQLSEIATQVWGHCEPHDTSAYRQVLRTLRRKLKESCIGAQLINITRQGYCIV